MIKNRHKLFGTIFKQSLNRIYRILLELDRASQK